MRYFGGGIGHLNNTPPQQADPLGSNSDEMDMEENENDTGSDARDGPQDVVMKDRELEMEMDETEEGDRFGDNDDNGDDSDNYDYEENDEDEDGSEAEAEEPTCGSDKEDDYGYASP
jgi:hypothetical protein